MSCIRRGFLTGRGRNTTTSRWTRRETGRRASCARPRPMEPRERIVLGPRPRLRSGRDHDRACSCRGTGRTTSGSRSSCSRFRRDRSRALRDRQHHRGRDAAAWWSRCCSSCRCPRPDAGAARLPRSRPSPTTSAARSTRPLDLLLRRRLVHVGPVVVLGPARAGPPRVAAARCYLLAFFAQAVTDECSTRSATGCARVSRARGPGRGRSGSIASTPCLRRSA